MAITWSTKPGPSAPLLPQCTITSGASTELRANACSTSMHVPACRLTAAFTNTPPPAGPVSVYSTAVAAPRSTESPTADTFHPFEGTPGLVVGVVAFERG